MAAQRAHPGLARAALALVRSPSLWGTGIRQARRLAPTRWWAVPPFLPLPRREYLRYRLETQYGTTGAVEPEDLVVYLRWVKDRDR
jgi:hypothetical protein